MNLTKQWILFYQVNLDDLHNQALSFSRKSVGSCEIGERKYENRTTKNKMALTMLMPNANGKVRPGNLINSREKNLIGNPTIEYLVLI